MRALAGLAVALALGCGARTELEVTPTERPDAALRRDAGTGLDATSRRDGPSCAMRRALTRVVPSVVLVLDRSGSMLRPLGATGTTRDDALREALALELPSADDAVRIGAVLYPHGATAGSAVCTAPRELDVAIELDTATAIGRALELQPPAGGTPTTDATVVATEALLRPEHARGPRAILLATDGGPNCHPASMGTAHYGLAPEACIDDGIPVELCIDTERTVAAIAAAADAGIPTYVVGMDVTLPILVDALDRMAIAGGRPSDGSTRFFDVERPEEIGRALRALVDEIERCTFVADGPGAPSEVVYVDGEALRRDETSGFVVDGDAYLLRGASCDRALAGARVELGPPCL